MVSNNDALDIFAFVAPGHPFAATVARFRDTLRSAPAFADFPALAGSPACDVHAEIKAVEDGAGGWRLERMYWSLQRQAAGRFRADTAYLKRGDELRVFGFPEDPSLRTMAEFFGGRDTVPEGVEVLRYVPLRRLTFRCARSRARGCIGKLKRASKIDESYARLAAVYRAARHRDSGIAVARPLALARGPCVFYQSALRGAPLIRGIDAASAPDRLRHVGMIHRRLHGLAVEGVGDWSLAGYRAVIGADVRWIGLFLPEAGARLASVLAALDRCPPRPVAPVFCHGDFVASQLLRDADTGRVAVTDFDMARHGDPDQERAKLLASFKYDLPYLRRDLDRGLPLEAAHTAALERAYLDGYAAPSRHTADHGRLGWFRICAEIHYLALMLRKDGWRPRAFADILDFIAGLADELRRRQ